jgi:hypothetical protein
MTTDTVSWYITFGFGGEWGGHYTEIRVPAHLSPTTQEEVSRLAAFDRYGKVWAFQYAPEQFERCIQKYGMKLREVLDLTEVQA